MRALSKNIKIKLLEDNPVPDLPKMLSFMQRYQAIQDYTSDSCNAMSASKGEKDANGRKTSSELTHLVALVFDMGVKQQQVEKKANRSLNGATSHELFGTRDCNSLQTSVEKAPNDKRCYECQGFGHFALDFGNHLNESGWERSSPQRTF